MKIEFRKMEESEAKLVQKIGRKSFGPFEGIFFYKPKKGMLAVADGEIAGGAVYKIMNIKGNKRVAYVAFAFVSKEYRGIGIGKKLYHEVTEMIKKEGVDEITTIVADDNVASWKPFQNCGYNTITFSEFFSKFGILGGIKVWFGAVLAWAVGHQMWIKGATKKTTEFQEFVTFILLNLFVLMPGLLRLSSIKTVTFWIIAVNILIITPALVSKIMASFYKEEWEFQAVRGGVFVSLIVSGTGGSLPMIGRMYPKKYEKTADFKRKMGLISLAEWVTIFVLIIISDIMKETSLLFEITSGLGKGYLLYHTIPVYPFAYFGGKRIWDWNKYLLVILLVIWGMLVFI